MAASSLIISCLCDCTRTVALYRLGWPSILATSCSRAEGTHVDSKIINYYSTVYTKGCICLAKKNQKPQAHKKKHCDFVLDYLVCMCVLSTVGVCGFNPLLQDKFNPLYILRLSTVYTIHCLITPSDNRSHTCPNHIWWSEYTCRIIIYNLEAQGHEVEDSLI